MQEWQRFGWVGYGSNLVGYDSGQVLGFGRNFSESIAERIWHYNPKFITKRVEYSLFGSGLNNH